MKCPNCHQEAKIVSSAIKNGKIITTCEHCSRRQQPSTMAAKNRREQQKKDFRKDLVQPTDKRAYSKAYPDDARKLYGDEEFRKLS